MSVWKATGIDVLCQVHGHYCTERGREKSVHLPFRLVDLVDKLLFVLICRFTAVPYDLCAPWSVFMFLRIVFGVILNYVSLYKPVVLYVIESVIHDQSLECVAFCKMTSVNAFSWLATESKN